MSYTLQTSAHLPLRLLDCLRCFYSVEIRDREFVVTGAAGETMLHLVFARYTIDLRAEARV